MKALNELWSKRWIRRYLSECDMEIAKGILSQALGDSVIPKELSQLLDQFMADSSVDNALKLIGYDHKFVEVFFLAKQSKGIE